MDTARTEMLTMQERGWLAKASRIEREGWIHLSVNGEPFERGFQHGYLTAVEYAEALRVYQAMTFLTMGLQYQFFIDNAVQLHLPIIDRVAPELLEEMRGIAAGYTRAGVPTTLAHIVAWNSYEELTANWWPTVAGRYQGRCAGSGQKAKRHSSAFIATGSATRDSDIVIGHQSFAEFWSGQFLNVMLDISPAGGQRMVMQICPGWIASMTGFWLTGAGLVVAEATLLGCSGYDVESTPEYIRVRKSCQQVRGIEQWAESMAKDGAGRANRWLVGDTREHRIACYEQGLKYRHLEQKTDGFFFGDGLPDYPSIRSLECDDTGYNDVRQQTGARRTRWPQLLEQSFGLIDVAIGQLILADTYDVYLKCINPCGRTICAHYDVDPMYYVGDPQAVWNVPYFPAGSVDGKVTSSTLASSLAMSARFGRADGVAFDAHDFLEQNPQWKWQHGLLGSRPSRPWTLINGH